MLSQPIHPPHIGGTVEIFSRDKLGNNGGRKGPGARNSLSSCDLVPQNIYKPPKRQRKFKGPKTIQFLVWGEKGIRLSDALEGKWDGFEGRDDRFLFEDDRVQITLRLRVSPALNHLSPLPPPSHLDRDN